MYRNWPAVGHLWKCDADYVSPEHPYVIETLQAGSVEHRMSRHRFRFVIVPSNTVYPHCSQCPACTQAHSILHRWTDEALEVGQGLFGQELRGVLNFCMHDQWGWMVDGDGVGARRRERASRENTGWGTSNGSLMRDGQRGLYLITNQHSFEFSGEGKCEL